MLLVLHVLAFDFTSKLDIGFGIICVASFESFTLLLEVVDDTEFTRVLASAFLRERCYHQGMVQLRRTVILGHEFLWITTEIRINVMVVNPALHACLIGYQPMKDKLGNGACITFKLLGHIDTDILTEALMLSKAKVPKSQVSSS